jgi:membrane-associated phospholipid phosphatase
MRRGGEIAGVAAGVAVAVATGMAARRGVSAREARVFQAVNTLPDQANRAIWVPMQYGTFGTVPALATLALLRRHPRMAVALATAGTAAWFLAKAVKPLVGRSRPAGIVSEAIVRGTEEGDEGFPSGHAAVSAALTVVAWPYLPGRWKPLPAALAAAVPVARVYVGAHLPLDVIGGSALGVAVGFAVNVALGTPSGSG